MHIFMWNLKSVGAIAFDVEWVSVCVFSRTLDGDDDDDDDAGPAVTLLCNSLN